MGSRAGVLKGHAARNGIEWEEYQLRVARGEKWCVACRGWHPVEAFGLDASRWDGRVPSCREARNNEARRRHRPRLQLARPAGRRFVTPRDGDVRQARARINYLVDAGLIPDPNECPCTDCGHVYEGERPRHEYDHHLAYAAEHHEHVEPVCAPCHHRREASRER